MPNVKISDLTLESSPASTALVELERADGLSRHCDLAQLMSGMPKVAQVPDNTATGGNARGAGAVDWQTSRTDAAQVASGNHSATSGGKDNTASSRYATVGGGTDNTASGYYSTIAGGYLNTASGSRSVVSGGYNNTASGNYSFIGAGSSNSTTAGYAAVVGGYGNTSSDYYSLSGGYNNVASGNYAVAFGRENTSSGIGSSATGGRGNIASGLFSWVPGGTGATTREIAGAGVYSASKRAIAGDRQTMVLPISCAARTDATPTVMTSDAGAASATNQMVLPNNSSMIFEVDVIAHDAALKSASWKVQGTIRRGANAAATTIVGTNVTTTLGSDLSGGSPGVTCTSDTTNGALQVTFTGIEATTIYPSGHIRTVIAA